MKLVNPPHRLLTPSAGRIRRVAALPALALALAASPASAQYPAYEWSQGIGGTSGDDPRGIAVDGPGNAYVTGSFGSSVDFGGGPVTSAGSGDVFLAKYDPDGDHVWSRAFGGTSSDDVENIARDHHGNLAITGAFRNTANFGGPASLASAGSDDAYVAVYDVNGNHLWSRAIGGTSGDDGRDVAFDADGNLLVTGYVRNDVDFGGGTESVGTDATAFLAKYDGSGNHLWSHVFTGTSTSVGNALATDTAGNVVLAGQLAGTVNFGGGNLTSAGSDDTFVVKLDANGGHQWSSRYGNANYGDSRAVECDSDGNVILGALIQGTVNFGGEDLRGLIGANIVLAKYDASGNHLWSDTYGESQSADAPTGLDVDASGAVYMTGYFQDTTDFGGGPVANGGDYDIFVAKFAPDGSHEWSAGFGTTGSQQGRDIAVDGTGRLTIAGQFANVIDLGGGFILPVGGSDICLARYGGDGATGVPTPANDAGSSWARAYPSPFRSTTAVEFSQPAPGPVSMDVYDARGARVTTLVDGVLAAGEHRAPWSGRDDAGRRVAPGVYFVRLRGDHGESATKVVRVD